MGSEISFHHVSLNTLSLVYPPISNQEGEWLYRKDFFKEITKKSQLYFLAMRVEIFFRNEVADNKDGTLKFDLEFDGKIFRGMELDLMQFLVGDAFNLSCKVGPKIIKIFLFDENGNEIIDLWYTPDSLIYFYSKNEIQVDGLENCTHLLSYELLYVGISKENNSVHRLFEKPHHARLKILSNETQKRLGARLSDELMVFLFDIEDLQIKMYNSQDASDISELADDIFEAKSFEKKRLVADAEKAFIKILDSKYNLKKYDSYPECTDGLFQKNLDRYSYVLCENITFKTPRTDLIGSRNIQTQWAGNSDLIIVQRDTVQLIKNKRYLGPEDSRFLQFEMAKKLRYFWVAIGMVVLFFCWLFLSQNF